MIAFSTELPSSKIDFKMSNFSKGKKKKKKKLHKIFLRLMTSYRNGKNFFGYSQLNYLQDLQLKKDYIY